VLSRLGKWGVEHAGRVGVPRRPSNQSSSRKDGNVSVTICTSCSAVPPPAFRCWNSFTSPWNDPPKFCTASAHETESGTPGLRHIG